MDIPRWLSHVVKDVSEFGQSIEHFVAKICDVVVRTSWNLARRAEWGDVPTWIGATAAIAGAFFVWRQLVKFRQDSTDAQAHRVVAWTDASENKVDPGDSSKVGWFIHIVNGADEPIFNVCVKRTTGGMGTPTTLGTTTPVMPARSNRVSEHVERFDTGAAHNTPSFYLAFTDSRGKHWIRDAGGVLRMKDVPMSGLVVGGPDTRLSRPDINY